MIPNRRSRGFTLIELMMAIAVIAILAAIAFPSYQKHLAKGRRAAAQAYLMDIAQREQQYFLDQRVYAPDVATLNAPMPDEMVGYYQNPITITTTAGPPPGFTASAVPIGSQLENNEPTLSIDQSGAKTPTGSAYGAW